MAIVIEDPRQDEARSEHERDAAPPRSHRRFYGAAIGVAVVLVVAIAGFARSGSSSALPRGVVREDVRQGDRGLSLSEATVPAGRVGFVITNDGTMGHELVVFRTDVPADTMPMGTDGRMNEDSPLVRSVLDTGGNIAPGHTRTIIVNLPAGHYVAVCNLPGHYLAGMHTDLTVR